MNLEPWIESDKRRGTYQVRWRDAGGVKHRDEFTFRDKTSATERKKQVWDLLERKALGHVDDTRSPAMCVEAFLEDQIGQKCEERMETAYRYGLKSFLEEVKASIMRDITRIKILEYKSSLYRKGFTDHTIATYLPAVRVWLKWAKAMEWINENPFVDIGVPTPKRIDRFYTDAEILAFEKAIDHSEFRCMFRFGYMVGLRPAEILRLHSDHFLYIQETKKWVLMVSPDETKTSTGRSVAVPDMVMEFLPKQKGLIFAKWNAQRRKRHFASAKEKAQIKDRILGSGRKITKIFYWTRHTYARRFLERGGRLNILQILMGHATYKITADTYGHMEKSHVLDQAHAMNAVGGYLETEVCGAIAGQLGQTRTTNTSNLTQSDAIQVIDINGNIDGKVPIS